MISIYRIIHVVDSIDLPSHFYNDAYTTLSLDPYTINFVSSGSVSSRLYDGTTTVFAPRLQEDQGLSEDIFENHLFFGLWFKSDLLSMNGKNLTSVNEKTWRVSVADGSITLVAESVGESDETTAVAVTLLEDGADIL